MKSSGDIPSHILKMTSDLSFNKVTNIAIAIVQSCIFADPLKLADVSPVYKDGNSRSKSNYGLISVLSTFSKLLKSLLKRQMAPYMEPKPANIICGVRDRQYSTALLRVIETIHMHIEQSGVCGMVLMVLSKA